LTISAGDIKLIASSVMDDVPEGGGAPSATIIEDATSNTIFPDISELDRAGGRVNLRKVFAQVRTADTDGFFGANIIVAEPFEDPRVSATLFATGDVFDRRSEAAARMESYLARGAAYPGLLFGDHLEGQSVVMLLQRNEEPLPIIGKTFVLTKNQGLANEFAQFVRVTAVSSMVRTFEDDKGEFKRTQVICNISDQLQADFNGFEAARFNVGIDYTGKTRVSDTVIADAARYYGVVPITSAVAIGDFTVQAASIFTQLVPSTRIEVPIADARMNQQSAALVKAGDTFSRNITTSWNTATRMFVGGGILPGSLTVSASAITVRDKGGLLVNATDDQVGIIDYANGVLTLSTNVYGAGQQTFAVNYTPAFTPILVAESFSAAVTTESQRLSWVFTLDPPPARGSLQISYRSGGTWYVLSDDGSGALRGSTSSIGAGTLNESTGTVTVTLGALPDAGSSIIAVCQPAAASLPIATVDASGPSLPRRFGKLMTLNRAIKPGTLSLTWNDGGAKSATDTAGVLTGDATGTVNYATGIVDFRPNNLPEVNTNISVALTETAATTNNIASFGDGGTVWTATLPANQKANSVELSVVAQIPSSNGSGSSTTKRISLRITDNGSGSLRASGASGFVTVGTINYVSGAITLQKTVTAGYSATIPVYSPQTFSVAAGGYSERLVGYFTSPSPLVILNGPGAEQIPAPEWAWWLGSQGNAVEVRASGADTVLFTGSVAMDNIFLPANAGGYGSTTQFSLDIQNFDFAGGYYVKSGGTIVVNPNASTGVGTTVGSASLVGGMAGVLLTTWPAGASSLVTRIAGATQPPLGLGTPLVVTSATFRTAVSPLVNSGFQIAGTFAVSGATFTATPNSAGAVISGTAVVGSTPGSYGVFGKVDFEQGIAVLYFGRRVPVSMAADPGVVDLTDLGLAGVTYVQQYQVRADTLRYNATGYSYLPLDPDILGLNPVRLPADGRVPIFRQGTFAVLGHTGTVGPTTVANAQVINCGRTRLSRVRVVGNNGVIINTGYTADLDAGTVTFTNVAGYSQPVTVEHRIEDTALVSNAQITGQISFTRPSTHVYPVPGSYISSALVAGDVRARVQPAFDQVSWTNEWRDSPIGNSATGSYNDTLHPIVTTNAGALTERWALIFTNTTAFNVVGEHVGVIGTGNTGVDLAPLNPSTGQPYFTLQSEGWGLGWSVGNVLRFNTVGATVPVWVARTILQGPETVVSDDFTILVRGDVDRP
jgi:hypothetical protein